MTSYDRLGTAYFLNDLYKTMNDIEVSVAVSIYAMKAFKAVNQKILLGKYLKIR